MKADITASGEHAFQTGLGTWLKIVRGKKKREREREREREMKEVKRLCKNHMGFM